jgi:hypothetical protein
LSRLIILYIEWCCAVAPILDDRGTQNGKGNELKGIHGHVICSSLVRPILRCYTGVLSLVGGSEMVSAEEGARAVGETQALKAYAKLYSGERTNAA